MKKQGCNALARTLQGRVGQSLATVQEGLYYGEIQADDSLLLNHFPCPIPKGDYMLCGSFAEQEIFSGMRVLVARVGDDFCVVDGICSSLAVVYGKGVL